MKFDEALIREFEEHTEGVVRFNIVEEAKFFVDQLWPEIAADKNLENQPEIFKRLKKIYNLNLILILARLPNDQVIRLFKDGLQYYFTDMIDNSNLWELIRGKLVSIFDIPERDLFKEQLRKALLKNKQLITRADITRDNKIYPPSIAEWLVDYTSVVGVGKISAVALNEYFVKNHNFQKLSEQEKKIVRTLITVYEQLKRSSLEPEGLEEKVNIIKDGRFMVFREGRFENIDPRITDLLKVYQKKERVKVGGKLQPKEGLPSIPFVGQPKIELENQRERLTEAYLGPEEERKMIHQEETSLEPISRGDLAPMRQVLLEALNQKDRYKAIAALRILVQKGNLPDEFRNDEKISGLFKNFLKEHYQSEILADFQRNGFTTSYLSLFLQRVLKNQLGLSEGSSGRVGIQLENMLVKKGNSEAKGMVFGDLTKGEFVWQEIRDEGVRLSIKKEIGD